MKLASVENSFIKGIDWAFQFVAVSFKFNSSVTPICGRQSTRAKIRINQTTRLFGKVLNSRILQRHRHNLPWTWERVSYTALGWAMRNERSNALRQTVSSSWVVEMCSVVKTWSDTLNRNNSIFFITFIQKIKVKLILQLRQKISWCKTWFQFIFEKRAWHRLD